MHPATPLGRTSTADDPAVPTVAVVVTACDEAPRIRRCLASVVASLARARHVRGLLVVVDDGSTDGTGRIAGRMLASTSVDHLVMREEGGCPGRARRAGIDAALAEVGASPASVLLLCTDAGTVVPLDWVTRVFPPAPAVGASQLMPSPAAEGALVASGAAVGG